MFNRKKHPPIRSLVADSSQIEGNLRFSDGLRVDGTVQGDIIARDDHPSLLVISETAAITGQIRAEHIIINGTVKGPVHAELMLELQPKARIEGDVHYSALEMHQGAIIAGQLLPRDAVEKPALKLAANNQ